jgi:predicted nuclease of predicted toxin-antitoxin system
MKILLDENIDIRLKRSFPADFEVYTVKDMC